MDNDHPDVSYRGYWLVLATLMAAIGVMEMLKFAKSYLEAL